MEDDIQKYSLQPATTVDPRYSILVLVSRFMVFFIFYYFSDRVFLSQIVGGINKI